MGRPILRSCLAALLAALLVPSDVRAEPASAKTVTVGARTDTPPFVWLEDGPGLAPHFSGFLWRICERAVDRAGYKIAGPPVQFDANARREFLNSGKGPKGETIDLLCDPTTITLARMDSFLDKDLRFEFSPIIFIENGSFVFRKSDGVQLPDRGVVPNKDGCGVAQAKLEEQLEAKLRVELEEYDESSGQTKLWPPIMHPIDESKADVDKKQIFEFWGYVEGSTIGDVVEAAARPVTGQRVFCPLTFRTHEEAAQAFCAGKLRVRIHNQNMTTAAKAHADRKTFGHLS